MSEGIFSSVSAGSGRQRTGRRLRLPVVAARGGDHAAIHFFLTAVFQGPSRAEYKASLEDPFYEPHDRLLIKRRGRIVAHTQVTHRVMQFGPLEIPVAGLSWLATLAEYRGKGHGSRLLGAAEMHMAQSGSLVGLMRTSIPRFFRRTGWAVCGRHSYSRADARAVLARLLDRGLRKPRRRLQIRPWRRWEEAALRRIYNQNLPGTYGALLRTGPYWRWLLQRQAYSQIYVALDGPDLLELEEINTRIVGYAVTRGEQIVELLAAPEMPRASAELVARCCGDAIEHDRHSLVLHTRPGHPWHKVFRKAGGFRHHHESDRGEVYMARLLEPLKLLRLLGGEFHRRAESSGLPRPLELGLLVEGRKYRLNVDRQGCRVVSRRLGHSYLKLNVADFTRLVMGQLDWSRALAERRVQPSDSLAKQAGPALFPSLPLWRPPFDSLPA